MKKVIAISLLAVLCLFNYIRTDAPGQNPYLITDYSRLHPVRVKRVVQGKEEQQLIALVREARRNHMKISIAGQRHSQGGHTYYKDGIVVDMTPYNKILSIDPAEKKVQVQAGATWKQIQDAINPYGLSLMTMQSQDIFSVGGSISVNAHGRDTRYGSLIESVDSFRLLTADGKVLNVSRTQNARLFPLVIGGYGLFGIILDVTLKLVKDEVYQLHTDTMTADGYSAYFEQHVLGDPAVHMNMARLSVAPDHFLTQMYDMRYVKDPSVPLKKYDTLKQRESFVIPFKFFYNLDRTFGWGKNLFWNLQKSYYLRQNGVRISRNNAMRPASEFLAFTEPGSNDLLQEYFIPVDEYAAFVRDFRKVLLADRMNLMNITVRYVKKDREAELSYAQQNMFALVCLFHVSLSSHAQSKFQQDIRQVIDTVQQHHGTYYLPYAGYPSLTQFHASYPDYRTFFKMKDRYDPQHLFMNEFYQQYHG